MSKLGTTLKGKAGKHRVEVKRYKIRTPLHDAVINAVGKLYDSQPSVKRFTMKRGPDGVYSMRGHTWYREPWMDEMLNAYAKLKGYV